MRAAGLDSAVGQVINIATGNKITLNELLNTFCDIKQATCDAEYRDPREGDIKESYANVCKAAELLDWNATVKLEQGLRALIAG